MSLTLIKDSTTEQGTLMHCANDSGGLYVGGWLQCETARSPRLCLPGDTMVPLMNTSTCNDAGLRNLCPLESQMLERASNLHTEAMELENDGDDCV